MTEITETLSNKLVFAIKHGGPDMARLLLIEIIEAGQLTADHIEALIDTFSRDMGIEYDPTALTDADLFAKVQQAILEASQMTNEYRDALEEANKTIKARDAEIARLRRQRFTVVPKSTISHVEYLRKVAKE